MADDQTPRTGALREFVRSRGLLWELMRLHGPALLVAMLLAAITGSSILTALALIFLACVASRLCIWRAVTTEASPYASHALYTWSYAAGCLVFALAAGAGFAIAALADAADMPEMEWPLDVLLPAAWCVGGVLWWRAQTGQTGDARQPVSLLPGSDRFYPVHVTLGIERFVLVVATGASAIGVLLSRALNTDAAEVGGTAVVAMVALVASLQFALELRQLIAGVPVNDDVLRALTASIGRAAEKTGAVRTVQSVEAINTGPGTVLAIVQLEFKDGVAAQHLAPVLAALRAAAIAEVPQACDVLLAPPKLTSGKGS